MNRHAQLARLLAMFIALPLMGVSAQPSASPAAHAFERSANGLTLQVDALRADVLRVRVFPEGHTPEDSSWAVLPASRTARAATTPTADGFSTGKVVVKVAPDLRLTVTDTAGHVLQSDAEAPSFHGSSFHLRKAMDYSDHFFGLGDKPGPLDRRNESFVMWNTDNFGWQESTDPIYKDIPFFLDVRGEGRTVGVFLDNTYRTFFDFGHELTSEYGMSAPDGPATYYLLAGPTPKDVVEAYAWLTGPTPLPPLWSLGYQQSRYSYYPQAKVEEIAHRLRTDRIPTDVLWLDIDYQYKNRPFTVDTASFPDFKGMIADLRKQDFRTIAITDLHVAHLPDQGYAPYDSGHAQDEFVKENGQEYVGPVWPGPSVFPDFTQARTRQWWGTLFKQFVADGVAGFWNDMDEPAVFTYPTKTMPDDVQHRINGDEARGFADRTTNHLEIHNVFGMENTEGTYDGELALRPDTRPFVMTRATYAGGQRYAVTWTGDNLATWNHLRQTTPQLLNLGLSGFAMAGADVGGFGGSPSPELLTRWLILGAFQPIDRDHSAKGTRTHEPWVDGPEQEAIRRRYIEERYRLMPYLYATAEQMSRTGLPITRPLFLEFPDATADGHPMDLDGAEGEFMFGPDLLIAASALPDDIAPYNAALPPGVWYDYWTGARLDRRVPVHGSHAIQDQEIRTAEAPPLPHVTLSPKLDQLPIFVRAGAIVPMQPLVQSTAETPSGPLTLRVYPPAAGGDPCSGDVYLDDGTSFGYRRGDFARMHVTCAVSADGKDLTVALQPTEGHYKPWWGSLRIEVVGKPATTPVTAQAEPIEPDGSYSQAPLPQLGSAGLTPTSALRNGQTLKAEPTPLGFAVILPYTGRPEQVTFR